MPSRGFGTRVHKARLAALFTFAALLAAGPLTAQSIQGVVREDSAGTPIDLVELWLLIDGVPSGGVVRSDAEGRFVLPVPRLGRYALGARRIGYAPLTSAHVNVGPFQDLVVEVRLEPRATLLGDPVSIKVARSHFLIEGFEHRRRSGIGTFFSREDIVDRGSPNLVDLLREVPGVMLPSAGGSRQPTVTMARRASIGRCSAVLFLDGIRVNRSTDPPELVRGIYESLSGNTLEAVEVYKGRSQLPAEFGGPEVRCGAIVVWTRRPNYQPRDSSP